MAEKPLLMDSQIFEPASAHVEVSVASSPRIRSFSPDTPSLIAPTISFPKAAQSVFFMPFQMAVTISAAAPMISGMFRMMADAIPAIISAPDEMRLGKFLLIPFATLVTMLFPTSAMAEALSPMTSIKPVMASIAVSASSGIMFWMPSTIDADRAGMRFEMVCIED